ncbi:MAG: hypothetical protein KIH08_10165 [Candidatus Freyarchaeota archaeon]|nr:hypothetical protein [Candidatus Jordarchaeia archaeon]
MERRYFLLSFLVPVLVRSIPEVVSFPWPIGYDTVMWYAPFIYYCQTYGFFLFFSWFVSEGHFSFLFYVLIGGLGVLSGADPFLVLKFVPPLLCGFLGCAVFYFCSRFLDWNVEKSLFCAVLASVYFVSLGLSLGFFRNMFSLGFFFVALAKSRDLESWRGLALFLLFLFLCVSSHEVVTFVLFFVVSFMFFKELYDILRGGKEGRRSLVGLILGIAICFVFVFLYSNIFNTPWSSHLTGGAPFLVDYTSWGLSGDVVLYPSVIDLGHHVLLFFLFCYAPLIPFVLWGYFKCSPLDAMSLVLLAASFMPLFLPHSALPYWWRWMIMLVFPFAFYASNALFPSEGETIVREWLKRVSHPLAKKAGLHNPASKNLRIWFDRRRVFLVFAILVSVLSFTFMVFPYEHPFPYYSNSVIQFYFPSSMQANTLPISECDEAMLALTWLNWNMPQNSCLIAHKCLSGWAELNVNFRPIYSYSGINIGLSQALEQASSCNSTYVITTWTYDYFIRTSGFTLIFNLGPIEVFKK